MADVRALQAQVQQLAEQELWESAGILAGLVICASSPEGPASGPGSHARSLELMADVCVGKGEHRRALSYYRQAAQQSKLARGRAGVAGAADADATVDAGLRYKESQCLLKLGDSRAALTALERVPLASRTLPMNLLLGRLYRQTSLNRNAVNSYKEALRQSPYALEAVQALVGLGVSAQEVQGLVSEPFVRDLAQAHFSATYHNATAALADFAKLERQFPDNVLCLLESASLHAQQRNDAEALRLFARARALDELNLDCTDTLAAVVSRRGTVLELSGLAQQLLSVDDRRAEPWVAVALYAEARGKPDKALGFADKAIALNRDHVPAHQLRGALLLKLDRAEHAVMAYFHAKALRADLPSFEGLVQAYLASGKLRVALCTAREALTLMPRSALAIALIGQVLAQSADSRDKAKRAFTKAMAVDPTARPPLLALVDLLCEERDFEGSVQLLNKALEHDNHPSILAKLAEVYTQDEQFQPALTAYHAALSLDAGYAEAQQGLARLEMRMKGIDPDASDLDVSGGADGMGDESYGDDSAEYQ